MILRIDPRYERVVVARTQRTTWVWVKGQFLDLEQQLADLDTLLREDEKATIRAAYGWQTGDMGDVLCTQVDYVPPALAG